MCSVFVLSGCLSARLLTEHILGADELLRRLTDLAGRVSGLLAGSLVGILVDWLAC